MNFLNYDSPLMRFLSTFTDLMILDILCFICCIPIVTIGPALCAKYAIAMKIARREDPVIVKPYFEAFKENFKQSFIAWLFCLAACLLLCIDWTWMYEQGFGNVNPFYFGAAAIVTVLMLFIIMTVFPIIARFEVTVKEAFKTSVLFSMLYFFGLLAIVILILFSLFMCIKYIRWLPLVIAISHPTIVFCLCLVLIRGFKKLEGNTEEEKEDESSENIEKTEKEDSENED